MHTFFRDLAHGTQAPHLKAARVGQDGLVPLLKAMQTTKGLHDVQAGAHPQVEGVAQNDLCAHFFEAARHHTLDGAIGANGHEDGGLHHAMVERELATAGVAGGVGFEKFELQHDGAHCPRRRLALPQHAGCRGAL